MAWLCGNRVTVLLQSSSQSTDAVGGTVDNWGTDETITDAILNPKNGNERFVQGKDSVFSDYTLWVTAKKPDRTNRTVTELQRVTFGSRVFDIVFVANPLASNKLYKIDLREIV